MARGRAWAAWFNCCYDPPNDPETLKEFLAANKSRINDQDECGQTALHIFVADDANNPEHVQLFLDAKADMNITDSDGCKVLHKAARSGSVDMVEKLIFLECSLDDRDWNGETPVFHSLVNAKVYEHLAANYPECLDSVNDYGDTIEDKLKKLGM